MDDLVIFGQNSSHVLIALTLYRVRNFQAGLLNPDSKTEGPMTLGRVLGAVVCTRAGYHFMGLGSGKVHVRLGDFHTLREGWYNVYIQDVHV